MTDTSIYNDIAKRTDGNIYIGIVGPVRTGKSTMIKRFMDTMVIPNIQGEYQRERAMDELPQSAAGRTIMTTEPKFIPEEAVKINIDGTGELSVRMVDCVGYIVPSALGYVEEDKPRMVKTPWFEEEIPFNMAAEIGTQKVICEHSTIGIVVTTDGSISDIDRGEYEEAEERVIKELQEINKPFIVLLNCVEPKSQEAIEMASSLTVKYNVPVLPVNCLELGQEEIREILSRVLYEFPLREVLLELPTWIANLNHDHWLKQNLYSCLASVADTITNIRMLSGMQKTLNDNQYVEKAYLKSVELGSGTATLLVGLHNNLFYQVLTEQSGLEVCSEQGLMDCLTELSKIKRKYDKVKFALEEVERVGYGIVMPEKEEMTLEEPEIMKQGGQYGVRLKAKAPSIHMMRADIQTEVTPVVGSEKQSEDLVRYLLSGFEDDPTQIWDSNIFGKSLHDLVNEGLHTKLARMPADARGKLQETITRVINEGCSGLICIIL
jgi:stage IV sporulation protein A